MLSISSKEIDLLMMESPKPHLTMNKTKTNKIELNEQNSREEQ